MMKELLFYFAMYAVVVNAMVAESELERLKGQSENFISGASEGSKTNAATLQHQKLLP